MRPATFHSQKLFSKMNWGCLILLLGSAWAFDHTKYEGYRLVETTPETQQQIKFIREFGREYNVDFWLEPAVGHTAELFVNFETFHQLKGQFPMNGLVFHISEKNIAEELKTEYEGLVARGRFNKAYDINDYNTYVDIEAELDRLAGTCATGLTCSTSAYGQSYEGRNLREITLSTGAGRQTIVFDAVTHAREWLAGATVMNILDILITGYGTDADATRILDAYDVVVVPIVNPDGYDYTWTNDRMWRKNRSPNDGSVCVGTDINRNYAYGWSDPGADPFPCSDTYYGPGPASEPETSAAQTLYDSLENKIALVSYHTHGYYLLTPFGDCSDPPLTFNDVKAVETAACDAIEGTFGENWLCGNSCQELYETSGTTADWAMGAGGYKYSYTPELRNDGQDFRPPASSIAPSVEQMWNGMVAMIDEITAREA